MDAASRAQFIEKGYFVVRDALGPDHLRALNEEYSQRVEAEVPAAAPDGGPLLWAGFGKPDWPRRLWSKAYYDLVDPPAIAPLLADLFSDPQCEHTGVAHGSDSAPGSRHYRLDHDNIHFHPGFDPTLDISYEGRQLPKEYWSPGGIVRGGIHGGEAGPQGVAMVTCVYELLPVPEGCGGTTVRHGSLTPPLSIWLDSYRPEYPVSFPFSFFSLSMTAPSALWHDGCPPPPSAYADVCCMPVDPRHTSGRLPTPTHRHDTTPPTTMAGRIQYGDGTAGAR
jgi:hypothetical protein